MSIRSHGSPTRSLVSSRVETTSCSVAEHAARLLGSPVGSGPRGPQPLLLGRLKSQGTMSPASKLAAMTAVSTAVPRRIQGHTIAANSPITAASRNGWRVRSTRRAATARRASARPRWASKCSRLETPTYHPRRRHVPGHTSSSRRARRRPTARLDRSGNCPESYRTRSRECPSPRMHSDRPVMAVPSRQLNSRFRPKTSV